MDYAITVNHSLSRLKIGYDGVHELSVIDLNIIVRQGRHANPLGMKRMSHHTA
jgi:hypothetical protein